MGILKALGKAIKAPVKAANKMPGMGAVNKAVGKAPGMSAMGSAMGIGPSPNSAPMQAMQTPAPQPMPEIPNGGMNMETRDAPMPQDMGQMRPQGSMEAGPIDERLAQKRAEVGGQAFDSHMAQQLAAQQQAGQPQQQMGGMLGQLAQKFGQPRMGPQQQRPNMGRAMGGAMGKMFGR